MITIKEDALIIEIKHSCPQEALRNIQVGIINLIQLQAGNQLQKETTEDIASVLELLKQSME